MDLGLIFAIGKLIVSIILLICAIDTCRFVKTGRRKKRRGEISCKKCKYCVIYGCDAYENYIYTCAAKLKHMGEEDAYVLKCDTYERRRGKRRNQPRWWDEVELDERLLFTHVANKSKKVR